MRIRSIFAAALVAAISVLTAGCGQHFVPANVPSEPPVMPRAPKVGVDLYITKDYSVSQTMQLGQRAIRYISRTLRVGTIGIAWDYVVPSADSDTIAAKSRYTASIADIAALTAIAHEYDLQVEYRVLFQIVTTNGRSESMRPTNAVKWFHSLLTAETPALELAQQESVNEFIVGTEAASIESDLKWNSFFSQAAQIYHGTLSYATWGGRPSAGGFFSKSRVLPPVTAYGVTAYPDVNLPATASVGQLTAAWEKFLQNAPPSVLDQTAIDEIGIPAKSGSYDSPWAWNNLSGAADDQVQARWFQAVCTAAGHEHLRAIYFWNANLIDNPVDPIPSLVKFEGRPESEAAIKDCQQVANLASQTSHS